MLFEVVGTGMVAEVFGATAGPTLQRTVRLSMSRNPRAIAERYTWDSCGRPLLELVTSPLSVRNAGVHGGLTRDRNAGP